VIAVVTVAVVAIIAGVALGLFRGDAAATTAAVQVPAGGAIESTLSALAESTDATGSDVMVEVPDVRGSRVEDAETLLTLAGFSVTRVATPAGDSATGTVLAQNPNAGAVLQRGDTVEITYAEAAGTFAPNVVNDPDLKAAPGTFVVCIDPGHQSKANSDLEPVGPGATEKKAKVTGGATGTVTRQHEHDFTLAVALRLKKSLEAEGVTVVMTRMTSAVDISNSQRATIANKSGADLFVRIHADGSTNGDTRGLSTLYPKGNDWVAPISAESYTAAKIVHAALLTTTGAVDRGVVPRSDLSGFNWATVPSVLVECGFLSNPVEDKLLASADYQAKLVSGMTRGIMGYLEQ